jgi:hypothetical protein
MKNKKRRRKGSMDDGEKKVNIQHGYYCQRQARLAGIVEYMTPSGKCVSVTEVRKTRDDEATMIARGCVYVGEVTTYHRRIKDAAYIDDDDEWAVDEPSIMRFLSE